MYKGHKGGNSFPTKGKGKNVGHAYTCSYWKYVDHWGNYPVESGEGEWPSSGEWSATANNPWNSDASINPLTSGASLVEELDDLIDRLTIFRNKLNYHRGE